MNIHSQQKFHKSNKKRQAQVSENGMCMCTFYVILCLAVSEGLALHCAAHVITTSAHKTCIHIRMYPHTLRMHLILFVLLFNRFSQSIYRWKFVVVVCFVFLLYFSLSLSSSSSYFIYTCIFVFCLCFHLVHMRMRSTASILRLISKKETFFRSAGMCSFLSILTNARVKKLAISSFFYTLFHLVCSPKRFICMHFLCKRNSFVYAHWTKYQQFKRCLLNWQNEKRKLFCLYFLFILTFVLISSVVFFFSLLLLDCTFCHLLLFLNFLLIWPFLQSKQHTYNHSTHSSYICMCFFLIYFEINMLWLHVLFHFFSPYESLQAFHFKNSTNDRKWRHKIW